MGEGRGDIGDRANKHNCILRLLVTLVLCCSSSAVQDKGGIRRKGSYKLEAVSAVYSGATTEHRPCLHKQGPG